MTDLMNSYRVEVGLTGRDTVGRIEVEAEGRVKADGGRSTEAFCIGIGDCADETERAQDRAGD